MNQIEDLGGDIDYLVVSHPDADHYNLLMEVLDDVPVGRAWYVGERQDYGDAQVFDWLGSTPRRSTRLQPDYFDAVARPNPDINCGGAKVWILAAAIEHPQSRKNAMSIVFMVRFGDFEAVITGDATAPFVLPRASGEIRPDRAPMDPPRNSRSAGGYSNSGSNDGLDRAGLGNRTRVRVMQD